jgi:hypothetical protein
MDSIGSIIILMSVASLIGSAWTYSWGYKEGKREGYIRGKAITRHASSKVAK